MKFRIIILCLAFTSLPSQGGNFVEMGEKSDRTTLIESLLVGDALTGDNEVSYQHLPEMRAVLRSSPTETLQKVNSQLESSGAQVVETKGNFVLFKTSPLQPLLMKGLGDSTNYAVVLNTRTNNFGILTGRQAVALRDIADAAVIASDYGIEIVKQYPHLRMVFFQVSSSIDIANLTTELNADARVEYAYPEIIENLAQPL